MLAEVLLVLAQHPALYVRLVVLHQGTLKVSDGLLVVFLSVVLHSNQEDMLQKGRERRSVLRDRFND